MKHNIYILGIVSAMLLLTGTTFKMQHWPAASIILTLGTFSLLAVFLPAALVNHYKANGNKQTRILYIVTWLTCFVVFVSMLFKISHWPFAGYLVLIAVPFPFVVFLPVWLYVTSKINNFDINNTIYILFLLAIQAVFSVLLALNVSREKIDNTLQITTQLSSLNANIGSLQTKTDKSAVIYSADEVLIQIEACRQLLFNRTGITRESLNKRSTGERYFDSKNIPVNFLLASTNPPPATKLYNSLNNFIAELGKVPGNEDLVKQAMDIFELNDLADEDQAWPFRMFQNQYLTWILVELDGIENSVRVIKTEVLN